MKGIDFLRGFSIIFVFSLFYAQVEYVFADWQRVTLWFSTYLPLPIIWGVPAYNYLYMTAFGALIGVVAFSPNKSARWPPKHYFWPLLVGNIFTFLLMADILYYFPWRMLMPVPGDAKAGLWVQATDSPTRHLGYFTMGDIIVPWIYPAFLVVATLSYMAMIQAVRSARSD